MTVGTPAQEEPNKRQPIGCCIARQVSQELLSGSAMGKIQFSQVGRESPLHCVSEFHKLKPQAVGNSSPDQIFCSNTVFEHHKFALRLEAELHPLRLILSRLMTHPSNRKGLFNTPVDPVALKLPDYHQIIKRPMDLGTIKSRLHAVSYKNRRQVVDDIRLVFTNATTYNPPNNAVHCHAKTMLAFFEDQLDSFLPDFDETANDTTESSSSAARSPLMRTISSDPFPSPPLSEPNTPGTRHSTATDPAPPSSLDRKRRKRGSKRNQAHSCRSCKGQRCGICNQGCLSLEPALLICSGPQCHGTKIRKGAVYFVAPDGSRQYCERCHAGLPAVLVPTNSHDEGCRYKRDLLKRKNDEEIVEEWLTCAFCGTSVHQMCVMHSSLSRDGDFACPSCLNSPESSPASPLPKNVSSAGGWTFVAGSDDAAPLEDVNPNHFKYSADNLVETPVSRFIQSKVVDLLKGSESANAEKTVLVRVISDCDRCFLVPEVVQKHFRMVRPKSKQPALLPKQVGYRSKAIMLFQKIDGFDVCIFCMYVHEYEGEGNIEDMSASEEKRVYIAYLDSVEHFRPRECRTAVYQEILLSYLATARQRGYKSAHIWACPPSRGNSFVFWNHPASQRTPNQERLVSWYNTTLSNAVQRGIVTDVQSLYERCFEPVFEDGPEQECGPYKYSGAMICPPLLEGDFWIEEAVRVHGTAFARHMKSKTADGQILGEDFPETSSGAHCAVVEIAKMLRDRVIAHPDSAVFRRPVNAAALKLKDYHKIITTPMDLGTIYSKCAFGEYLNLNEFVADFELMVSNAKRFNPKGHFVHTKAEELTQLFFSELNALTSSWNEEGASDWTIHGSTSLALDGQALLGVPVDQPSAPKAPPDDLFCGGSKAVQQRMVGNDTWLLEKQAAGAKSPGQGKGKKVVGGKRRKSLVGADVEPPVKRRRQSWLGEEVGASVRRARPYIFACSLSEPQTPSPQTAEKAASFAAYVESFQPILNDKQISSRIADSRQTLLEFCQHKNLEFDTLRHSKFSTAVLLQHLHDDSAAGVLPLCCGCDKEITGVRWHKIGKVIEDQNQAKCISGAARKVRKVVEFTPEELCASCFDQRTDKDDFIPVQVTLT